MAEKQARREIKRIPSLDFHDLPLDIHFHIQQEPKGYEVHVITDGYFDNVTVKMTHHELAKLNERLQNAMRVVAEECTSANISIEESIYPLAKVGYHTFKRIFQDDAWIAIQELLERVPRGRIQVSSDCFFLPWELIYPISLEDAPLSYENFWGMKYVISRSVRPGNRFSPFILIAKRPRLGLLTYHRLINVSGKEVPFFERLANDGKIVLFKLRALHCDKKLEELKTFRRFWKQAFHLVHFACHATHDREDPNLSCLLLSNEFSISLEDLEVYPVDIDNNPLIIMNACGTGALNPLYTQAFVNIFLRYGARGVVATECNVPDTFAADFAKQLYPRLLAGESLGESLLATRRYFLERGNPSGLLYSMYAPPSTRLQYDKS